MKNFLLSIGSFLYMLLSILGQIVLYTVVIAFSFVACVVGLVCAVPYGIFYALPRAVYRACRKNKTA